MFERVRLTSRSCHKVDTPIDANQNKRDTLRCKAGYQTLELSLTTYVLVCIGDTARKLSNSDL